jgi:hypothetical protein
LYIAKAATASASFLLSMSISRFLGIQAYGLYTIWLSAVTVAGYFTDAGSGLFGPHAVLQTADKLDWRISAIQGFRWLLAGIAVILAIIGGTKQWVYAWVAPMIVLQPANVEWVARAKQKFGLILKRQLFQALITLILAWAIYGGFLELWIVFLGLILVFGISHGSLYRRTMPKRSFFQLAGKNSWPLVADQAKVFAAFVLYNVFYHWPIFVGGFVCDKSEIGQYGLFFLLYAFSATLALIAQDLYLSDPQKDKFKFNQHVVITSLIGLLIIGFGSFVILPNWFSANPLYTHKGALFFALLLLVHNLRLLFVHELYRRSLYRLFAKLHGFQMLLLLIFTLLIGFAHELTIWNLGYALLGTEATGIALSLAIIKNPGR